MNGYFLVLIAFMIIGFIVQARLRNKFKKYSKQPIQSGLSGREVAEAMLRDHGITDVKVQSVPGKLTDHYNPDNKTVNLSPEVYQGRSVAAAAVAAHECGHAVQHATAYSFLQMRSKLVPVVSFSSNVMQYVFMASLFLGFSFSLFSIPGILLFIICCQGAIALFSLITLPVEFDASNRALAWVQKTGIVTTKEFEGSKDALKWAAMTYVVAALAAVTQLLYFIMRYMGSDD